MKKVRMGIIGVGAEGGMYADFLLAGKVSNTELAAICDIDPVKKNLCDEKYPNVPFFTDYIEMLESGLVDAVCTTVPHYLHPEMGIQALKRNIHALLEKPAGVYSLQVSELLEYAATRPELTFGMMFNQRTNPLYQKIKAIVESGEIGAIRRSTWMITTWWRPQAYYNQSAWRATWGGEGGGVLVNQAPHQLDLWQWICGMPTQVTSRLKFGYQRELAVEDDVIAMTEYENGASGVFITCTHDLLGTDRFEIFGDKGKIIVEGSKKATVQVLSRSEQDINRSMTIEGVINLFKGKKLDDYEVNEYVIESAQHQLEQHPKVFENFSANILDGTPLLAPGSDGIKSVQLANAIHMSAFMDSRVNVPVDEKSYLTELNKKIAAEKARG
ncbi:MAG: Gfo/Idh/MocA family oxidoreductase [Eubacteriales bacterium]|nr:Gfo/Idh/MocA family oxidoreductase [Eubacteriales bacterium]